MSEGEVTGFEDTKDSRGQYFSSADRARLEHVLNTLRNEKSSSSFAWEMVAAEYNKIRGPLRDERDAHFLANRWHRIERDQEILRDKVEDLSAALRGCPYRFSAAQLELILRNRPKTEAALRYLLPDVFVGDVASESALHTIFSWLNKRHQCRRSKERPIQPSSEGEKHVRTRGYRLGELVLAAQLIHSLQPKTSTEWDVVAQRINEVHHGHRKGALIKKKMWKLASLPELSSHNAAIADAMAGLPMPANPTPTMLAAIQKRRTRQQNQIILSSTAPISSLSSSRNEATSLSLQSNNDISTPLTFATQRSDAPFFPSSLSSTSSSSLSSASTSSLDSASSSSSVDSLPPHPSLPISSSSLASSSLSSSSSSSSSSLASFSSHYLESSPPSSPESSCGAPDASDTGKKRKSRSVESRSKRLRLLKNSLQLGVDQSSCFHSYFEGVIERERARADREIRRLQEEHTLLNEMLDILLSSVLDREQRR